jgi:UDP-N-acetylglucosamine--N-acetylmuramyl-(pentapeptide) pyrophosphoryl-undecaprenol N-acetylglucosamine transferase
MGKVNRYMSNGAKKVFVSYPANFYPCLDREKTIFSGPLLRDCYIEDQVVSGAEFCFSDNNKPIIFLTGGSQGSLNLSENFIPIIKDLLPNFNIIHQAGKHSIEVSREFQKTLPIESKKGYCLSVFLRIENGKDWFLEAVNAASLVITRAGSTIIELAIKGKPMILVPWKHSAQDHQLKNARFLLEKEAAAVITDDELNPKLLLETILKLFSDDKKMLKQQSRNARKIFPKNGTEKVIEEILKEV